MLLPNELRRWFKVDKFKGGDFIIHDGTSEEYEVLRTPDMLNILEEGEKIAAYLIFSEDSEDMLVVAKEDCEKLFVIEEDDDG